MSCLSPFQRDWSYSVVRSKEIFVNDENYQDVMFCRSLAIFFSPYYPFIYLLQGFNPSSMALIAISSWSLYSETKSLVILRALFTNQRQVTTILTIVSSGTGLSSGSPSTNFVKSARFFTISRPEFPLSSDSNRSVTLSTNPARALMTAATCLSETYLAVARFLHQLTRPVALEQRPPTTTGKGFLNIEHPPPIVCNKFIVDFSDAGYLQNIDQNINGSGKQKYSTDTW